jgi:aspartate kinase
VFSTFEDLGISVDVVATSEVSISLTLDPSKLWSRELIQQASVWCLYFSYDLYIGIILQHDIFIIRVYSWHSISSVVVFLKQELDHVVEELEKIAVVNLLQRRSIISLIGNVQRSSLILEKVLHCTFLFGF